MTRWLLLTLALVLFSLPASAQMRRVAVIDFVNTTKDPAMEWIGRGAAETLTTKLQNAPTLQLVERAHIEQVLKEQKLNLTDLVDPATAVAVGKLLGAEHLVVGAYTGFGGMVRFTARFVDTTTGRIIATSQADGAVSGANPASLFAAFDRIADAALKSAVTIR